MKVLVNCSGFAASLSEGIGNFALTIVESLATRGFSVVVALRRADLPYYREYFAGFENVGFSCDPVQTTLARLRKLPGPLGLAGRALVKVVRPLGFDANSCSLLFARRQQADVVFYPYHLDPPRHPHLPMVTTVHAVLPGYGKQQMATVDAHMNGAKALVTSFPRPRAVLTDLYPAVDERLFVVPITAVLAGEEADPEPAELPVAGPFYFYAATLVERKNHAGLLKAYGLLKEKGITPPPLVCTGGRKEEGRRKLYELAESLGVADSLHILGSLPRTMVTLLNRHCTAAVSASFDEAGIAAIQEGGVWAKPVLCSDIQAARDHARMVGLEPCWFDPAEPADIARAMVDLEENYDRYGESAERARKTIACIDLDYMGRCYGDVLSFAAGRGSRPSWAPYLDPVTHRETPTSTGPEGGA